MEIVNIQDCREHIPVIAGWIYNEFIKDHISNCTYSDIENAVGKRKIDALPLTFACLEGGICLGTISLFENDLGKLPQYTPWLAALYVDPKYRKRGIAKQLISEVIKVAGNLGYETIFLRTETAGEYYNNLGWFKVRDIVDENSINTTVYKRSV